LIKVSDFDEVRSVFEKIMEELFEAWFFVGILSEMGDVPEKIVKKQRRVIHLD
jgi:ABC-type uncharacterized transport system substrate-binding protein